MLKLKVILFSLLSISSSLFAQKTNDIIGKYHLPTKLNIEIYEYNGKYFGKIIALNGFKNGQKKDINNPDKSKRNGFLIGKVIITNLEYDKQEKEWINGIMYSPGKGMLFNLKIKEVKEKEIVVVGSKYIIWKTIKWKKLR